MGKIKAVVLEKHGHRCTVLCENGSFRHVYRYSNTEVGEEIVIRNVSEGFGGGRAWIGAAVIFFMVFSTMIGWNLYQAPTAVALLSVDINPSIQFSVDEQGNLLDIDSQNEDAERLLSNTDLKGKPINKVLDQFVTEAYHQKYINSETPWIVVGYYPLDKGNLKQDNGNFNEDQIVTWLTENAEINGFAPQVAFFTLTSQEHELAQKEHLTLGEYALWRTAVKAGVITQEESLSDTSERIKLLENPKVQSQVKEDKKELESSSKHQGEQEKSINEKGKSEKGSQKNVMDKEKDNKDTLYKEKMEKSDSIKSHNQTRGTDQEDQREKIKNAKDKIQRKDSGENGKDQEYKGNPGHVNGANNHFQE